MDVIFSFFSPNNKTDVRYIYMLNPPKKGGKSTLCFSAFFRQVVWGNSPEKPTSHRPKPASPEMDAELTVAVKPSHFLLKVNEAMAGTQVV